MKHCMQQIFRCHSILSNLYIYHLYHENHFSCFILHIKVFFYTCYLLLSVFFFFFLYTIWHKTLFQLHEDTVEYEQWEAGGHQLLSLVCLVILVETWTLQWGLWVICYIIVRAATDFTITEKAPTYQGISTRRRRSSP